MALHKVQFIKAPIHPQYFRVKKIDKLYIMSLI